VNLDHLVERLKKNRKDEQAQSALYTELLPDLVSWYERHGFSPHDSEDLAHDAIFKIIEKIKQCRYEPNKFIWTVAKNIARDKWRAPKISSYDSNKIRVDQKKHLSMTQWRAAWLQGWRGFRTKKGANELLLSRGE